MFAVLAEIERAQGVFVEGDPQVHPFVRLVLGHTEQIGTSTAHHQSGLLAKVFFVRAETYFRRHREGLSRGLLQQHIRVTDVVPLFLLPVYKHRHAVVVVAVQPQQAILGVAEIPRRLRLCRPLPLQTQRSTLKLVRLLRRALRRRECGLEALHHRFAATVAILVFAYHRPVVHPAHSGNE